jgi:hypothetical protein
LEGRSNVNPMDRSIWSTINSNGGILDFVRSLSLERVGEVMKDVTISDSLSMQDREWEYLNGRGSCGSFSYSFLDEFLLTVFLSSDKLVNGLCKVCEFGSYFEEGNVVLREADWSAGGFSLWWGRRSRARDEIDRVFR